ncbi:hypothetical protein PYCC9005_002838 [Savitreella phatthalungensis]
MATQSGGSGLPAVFDRRVKGLQRDRGVCRAGGSGSREYDYLRDAVAGKLVERMAFVKRELPHVVDLGGGNGHLLRALCGGTDGSDLSSRIGRYTLTDMSGHQLHRDPDHILRAGLKPDTPLDRVMCDEEAALPFDEASIDAVLSSLSLHWINDLPTTLASVRRILKPDAPFMAAMLGGDTLFELRTSLQLADLERRGGISPRVSPMTSVRDVGSLLGRAGFKLLTVDAEDVVVDYPDIVSLMEDLRGMGEGNAVISRELSALPRDVLLAAGAIYKELHGTEEGTLPATFNVLYMIGWAPGGDQPKPLERGSGETNLKSVLGKE